jgi:glyoxylase-like metal-dependent hydrolase (beta-lactamase superfamily II)
LRIIEREGALARTRLVMSIGHWMCTACGFWQCRATEPRECPACEDFRSAPSPALSVFASPDEVDVVTPVAWEEIEPGAWRLEAAGHAGAGYLIEHDEGNVLFECPPWISDAALAFIASRGGVRVATASHPHTYGALWRIVEAFAPQIPVHVADLPWARTFAPTDVYDTVYDLHHGRTLHHVGGHFDGQQVLFDARRGTLFCGDALVVELDPHDPQRAIAISCAKSHARQIPLTVAEVRRHREVLAGLDFTQAWTSCARAGNVGRVEVFDLLDHHLGSGRPHAQAVPLLSALF